jgi:hypothetical protein
MGLNAETCVRTCWRLGTVDDASGRHTDLAVPCTCMIDQPCETPCAPAKPEQRNRRESHLPQVAVALWPDGISGRGFAAQAIAGGTVPLVIGVGGDSSIFQQQRKFRLWRSRPSAAGAQSSRAGPGRRGAKRGASCVFGDRRARTCSGAGHMYRIARVSCATTRTADAPPIRARQVPLGPARACFVRDRAVRDAIECETAGGPVAGASFGPHRAWGSRCNVPDPLYFRRAGRRRVGPATRCDGRWPLQGPEADGK